MDDVRRGVDRKDSKVSDAVKLDTKKNFKIDVILHPDSTDIGARVREMFGLYMADPDMLDSALEDAFHAARVVE